MKDVKTRVRNMARKDPARYDEIFVTFESHPMNLNYTVKGIIYGGHYTGVLKGQDMVVFLDSYRTREEAEKEWSINSQRSSSENINYVDHLPGDDDPDPWGDDRAAYEEGMMEADNG